MALSNNLISQFVKVTDDTDKSKKEKSTYGTVKEYNGEKYVQIDGSNMLTPYFSTTIVKDGDRVVVDLKDHNAVVSGNITSPATRSDDFNAEVTNTAENFKATNASIDTLKVKQGQFEELATEKLNAAEANIDVLAAREAKFESVTTENFATTNASIENLSGDFANFKVTTTDSLTANEANITKVSGDLADFITVTTDTFKSTDAEITNLKTAKADIDLANIDVANIGILFNKVGLIDRATIVDGHITGFLDAVEINANSITAGTLIADRILLKGSENGLLYQLNNLGELTSANVDTLDGSILTERTVTADKLVAKSITTNELDVNNIFGNSAVLSTLVSQEAFINAINTNGIVVSASNNASSALSAANTANSNASTALSTANTANSNSNEALTRSKNISFDDGVRLYNDPTFVNGFNGINLYNNQNNGTVAINRIAKHSDNPTDSTHQIEITTTGYASPGHGGFYFGNGARANAVFVYRIIAKIPTGYYLGWASNAIGDGHTQTWLTSIEGTGKYTEYICKVVCGSTGSFSSTGFFYITGSSAPVAWEVAYATCYDMSKKSETANEIADNIYTTNTTTIDGGKITTGSITAKQIDVKDLFAQSITATGTITGVTLKGSTIWCNGSSESDSSAYIDYEGIHAKKYYSTIGDRIILNGFTGGEKYTADLLIVSGATVDGHAPYNTYIDTDNDEFTFMKPCYFPYGGRFFASLSADGNITSTGDITAGLGTDNEVSLQTLNSNLAFKFHGRMSNLNFNTYQGASYAGIWLNGGTNQSGTSNAPSTADNGYLFVFVLDEYQTKTIHIWVGIYKGIIQGRYYNGSSWTSWKTISSLR